MAIKSLLSVTLILSSTAVSCGRPPIPPYFAKLHSEKVASEAIVSWTQFGPGSAGYCDIVKYHPADPDCVLMSPDMFNSYRSLDNGRTWQTVNDVNGNSQELRRMRDMDFSRQNPDYGVMIDERGWFWTTRDRGKSWQRHAFPAQGVCSVIALDPGDDRIMYVGSGNFWNVKWNKRTAASPRREVPKPTALFELHCGDFAIPLQRYYQNIQRRGSGCAFDPDGYSQTDYTILSATEYGKVFRSTDRGQSWTILTSGLPEGLDVAKILFHPSDSKILYLASNYGLFKSEDRGDHWTNIGSNLPRNMLRDLAVYQDNKTQRPVLVVIAQVFWEADGNGGVTSSGGVFKSTDDGKTWQCLNGNLYLDLTPAGPAIVDSWYRAMGMWFEISTAEARTRFPVLPKQALHNFNRLLLDPTDPQRMYLGHNVVHDISFYGGDLWKTEDGGRFWLVCNRTGAEWQGTDKKFWRDRGNPINLNMTFAHLQRQMNERPYGRLGCRALTINTRGDLITVMEQQTLKSTDRGNSWQQIDAVETAPGSGCWVGSGCANLTRPRFFMDPRLKGQYLLPCGEHGMWQLCSGENSVNPNVPAVRQIVGQAVSNDDPHSIASIAIHPKEVNIWYMQMYRQAHAGHIRRTTDSGRTWENISRPIAFPLKAATDRVDTHSLLIEEYDPSQMYFCVPSWDKFTERRNSFAFNDFGVYHSGDAGYNWQRVNTGLPAEANVEKLCFDPDDSAILYAAVMKSLDLKTKGGLYRTALRGQSWHALPIPEEIESVNDVHIDRRGKAIYIACGTSDGTAESGGVWVSRDKGRAWEKIFHMPFVYQVTAADYDPARIAVAAAESATINNLNPGAYLSFDGGNTWSKCNQGLGQPYWIVDLKFDLTDPDILWCGLNGSGWYKGVIATAKIKAVK